jgi:hypothetical protein
MPSCSIGSELSKRRPAVSLTVHGTPFKSKRTSTISLRNEHDLKTLLTQGTALNNLVVPAMGDTMAAGLLASAFNNEDFPGKKKGRGDIIVKEELKYVWEQPYLHWAGRQELFAPPDEPFRPVVRRLNAASTHTTAV